MNFERKERKEYNRINREEKCVNIKDKKRVSK